MMEITRTYSARDLIDVFTKEDADMKSVRNVFISLATKNIMGKIVKSDPCFELINSLIEMFNTYFINNNQSIEYLIEILDIVCEKDNEVLSKTLEIVNTLFSIILDVNWSFMVRLDLGVSIWVFRMQ